MDEQSSEQFPALPLTTLFSSSGAADKREETSLIPEIKLHNKLKRSLEAPLLPLLSKPKPALTAEQVPLSPGLSVPLGDECQGQAGLSRAGGSFIARETSGKCRELHTGSLTDQKWGCPAVFYRTLQKSNLFILGKLLI